MRERSGQVNYQFEQGKGIIRVPPGHVNYQSSNMERKHWSSNSVEELSEFEEGTGIIGV